jgi:ATP-dependent helicase/nuclease subunit A
VRGPDLEGFVRFCDEQAALQVREGEAATAEEGRDAIVLMTVHAAKGLEFDVVALADCGRERASRHTRDILVDSGGRIALRAVDPATGLLRPALGYADVADRERQSEREEARRLQYVGMTRARHHLIVSGALDPGEETTIAHLCGVLGVDLDSEPELDVGDARLRVRVERPAEADPAAANGAVHVPVEAPDMHPVGQQLALFGEGGRTVEALPALAPIAAAPPVPLRRLSYSALSLYRRCGYRYFAQRVLGLPEPEREATEGGGLDALELGDAVHLELERADGRWRDLYPHASGEDEARIAAFVAAWAASPLHARVGDLVDARHEVAFAFDVDGVLFRGRLDVFGRFGDGTALIVDFKTNRLGERVAQEVMDTAYAEQVTTYALAALRSGAPAAEIAYAFLENSEAVAVRRFVAADAPGLEAELRTAIDAIRAGQFPARPGPHCRECPALDLLCAGPNLEWEG